MRTCACPARCSHTCASSWISVASEGRSAARVGRLNRTTVLHVQPVPGGPITQGLLVIRTRSRSSDGPKKSFAFLSQSSTGHTVISICATSPLDRASIVYLPPSENLARKRAPVPEAGIPPTDHRMPSGSSETAASSTRSRGKKAVRFAVVFIWTALSVLLDRIYRRVLSRAPPARDRRAWTRIRAPRRWASPRNRLVGASFERTEPPAAPRSSAEQVPDLERAVRRDAVAQSRPLDPCRDPRPGRPARRPRPRPALCEGVAVFSTVYCIETPGSSMRKSRATPGPPRRRPAPPSSGSSAWRSTRSG